jgi:hypothetical protein
VIFLFSFSLICVLTGRFGGPADFDTGSRGHSERPQGMKKSRSSRTGGATQLSCSLPWASLGFWP